MAQVAGVPSSPEATTTITGKQLRPADPKFDDQGELLGLEGLAGSARAARMRLI